MKQLLQHTRSGELRIEDVPAPVAQPGGLVVQNHFSVVSAGTERATVEFARKNMLGKARSRPDLVRQVLGRVRSQGLLGTYRTVKERLDHYVPLGYSSAGRVLEVGDGSEDFAPGDLISCAGSGYANHAEVVFVPRNLAARLPEGVTPRDGAFATLGAIALQGIRRADLTLGESVAVIGLGLLGRLTVQILRAYGFPVLGLDVNATQVEATTESGMEAGAVIGRDDVDAAGQSFSGGAGVDAVIITAATSTSEPVELAGRLLRERGRVSVVGDVRMDVPRRVYYGKELDLRVSRSYGPGRYDPSYEEHGIDYPLPYARWTEQRNMAEFLRLVSLGRLDLSRIATHTFSFERATEAYRLVVDNPQGESFLGVLLEYPEAAEIRLGRVELGAGRKARPKAAPEVLRAGLIGAGSFMRGTIVPTLTTLKGLQIEAVVSASGASANEVASKRGARYVASDYTEILRDPDVDVVFAATRHHMNARIAEDALVAGKHVHVEKPLALNLEELRSVAGAASGASALLSVGFNRRFAPDAVAAKSHFDGRTTPLMMHCTVNAGYIPADSWVHDPVQGGGRILGEVCHFVDLLHFFAGACPTRVFATRLPPSGDAVLHDDNVMVTVDFADGSRGSIAYCALGPERLPKERVELLGAGRAAMLDDFRHLELYRGSSVKRTGRRQDKGHLAQFRAFADAIRSGGPAAVPLEELLLSTLATLCILDSLRSGTPVQVDLVGALASGADTSVSEGGQ